MNLNSNNSEKGEGHWINNSSFEIIITHLNGTDRRTRVTNVQWRMQYTNEGPKIPTADGNNRICLSKCIVLYSISILLRFYAQLGILRLHFCSFCMYWILHLIFVTCVFQSVPFIWITNSEKHKHSVSRSILSDSS